MREKKYIFLILAGLAFVFSGCTSADTQSGTNMNKLGQTEKNSQKEDKTPNKGVKASTSDMDVGKKIMASGASNSDGSLSATRIMIGEFSEFGSRTDFASGTTKFNESQNQQIQNQNRQNRHEGQYQQRLTDGDAGQRPPVQIKKQVNSGGVRIYGEILKKDDTSLVVKVRDGGSKIIFYSDKTELFIFQSPTSTPPVATSTPLNAS